ncbi:hypothetical protein BDU57DRAFT_514342 [Ampelomyces quisqualis]|uniref:Uncharacterized protein n=1 Tax=Ampelomyces quisqualis TaxID=50730 RepID=A0A6A5QSQ1_AMPQU|nr:hypothetical protein BDU57DRAFT_514342 [Ampelomyces quisqualis]
MLELAVVLLGCHTRHARVICQHWPIMLTPQLQHRDADHDCNGGAQSLIDCSTCQCRGLDCRCSIVLVVLYAVLVVQRI